jgi:acylglycerol lipase
VNHHFENWKDPRCLVIFHGFGEHGGRYLHFPHYVQSVVSSVYCLDHRGHGRSEGLRGHVDRFDLYAEDAILAIKRVDEQLKKRFGKSEIHLLGHSLGGLVALRAIFLQSDLPLASVSISAPLLGVKVEVPKIKKWGSKILAKVWGSVHFTSEIDPRDLSHDKGVVETYITDRLVHKKVTPLFFEGLQAAIQDTIRRDSGIHSPIQMLIPLQDQVVNAEASLQFFRDLKWRDKLLKTYPNFFHEPFNEIGKEQVFEDLIQWIKSHSKS